MTKASVAVKVDWQRLQLQHHQKQTSSDTSEESLIFLETSFPSLCMVSLHLSKHPPWEGRIKEKTRVRETGMQLGCTHYGKFWRNSRGHYKPLTIFIPWNIQAALFPVKHKTILEVECNQTESNIWTYGRLTNSVRAGAGRDRGRIILVSLYKSWCALVFSPHPVILTVWVWKLPSCLVNDMLMANGLFPCL